MGANEAMRTDYAMPLRNCKYQFCEVRYGDEQNFIERLNERCEDFIEKPFVLKKENNEFGSRKYVIELPNGGWIPLRYGIYVDMENATYPLDFYYPSYNEFCKYFCDLHYGVCEIAY